jgi:L-threonylcarbamoyladenylate synthase
MCADEIQKVYAEAVALLRRGRVVAAPTETVYGLFADATSDAAVQEVYRIKGRPSCNPLIIHVSGIDMSEAIVRLSDVHRKVLDHFWNGTLGPLTVVLRARDAGVRISKLATAGLDTIAVRCPNHPISQRLIREFGGPLAAPSANISNTVSPTSYDMVVGNLGDTVELVIDGGRCAVGIESTILDMSMEPYRILRPGGVTVEQIELVLMRKIHSHSCDNMNLIKAPGMMSRHYAPSLSVRMNASYPLDDEAFIAFGPTNIRYDFNLSEVGDLNEACKNLFYAMQSLDDAKLYSKIAIMPIPNHGLGVSINDRLKRASSTNS